MSRIPINLDIIEGVAAAADAESIGATEDSRIKALEDRIANIEPLLEQMQASSELVPALNNYISDLRSEQKFFNAARYVVGAIAVIFVLFLVYLLRDSIYNPKSPLLKAQAPTIAAFIIGLISGVVLIISSMAKGVFRSTVERHADGFIPPALENALDVVSKISGKKN